MSIGLYDKALSNKIKSWVVDPNLRVLYPDETNRLFQLIIDLSNDLPLLLPLIAISRESNIELLITAKRPISYIGKTLNATDDKADHLNSVPMTLRYLLDIYTRYREEADEYVRNFIFLIITYPEILIELPYHNSGIIQKSYMELDSTVRDNSSIPERLIPGLFTRMTLGITLKDAQMFSYTFDKIPKVVLVGINTPSLDVGVDIDVGDVIHHRDDNCEVAASFDIKD